MKLSRFESDPPEDALGGRCVVRWFYRLHNVDAVALILCLPPDLIEAIGMDFQRAQRASSSEQAAIVDRFKQLPRYDGSILPEPEVQVSRGEKAPNGPAIEQLGLF